jgi:LuxR family maltose regulon positive regulatory protein
MPVLGTKLHLPTPRRQLVSRPRLTDQLLSSPHRTPRLVLVAAPAGFGKTTLVTQWLAVASANESPLRVAWLSLDHDDSDPVRFLAHVVAALQTTNPDIGTDALTLMDNDRGSPMDAILVSLVNDLDSIAGPTVLVLDDYHVIDTPDVHQAVTFLLDNLPPQVTLTLTTRADPPLPLSRLRARDELVELRAADLRFTDDEAELFLNEVMGLELGPEHIAALESRTEGWVAGLQLAALSARGRKGADEVDGFVDAFSGSHRFVLDYLLEEVLRSQPDDVRAFLLDTSVLSELTGPLCDAVTGRSDGQQTLEAIERSNLFLVPLDDRRQWFRYHHLFTDALHAQLTASVPGRSAELHRAAAHWYAGEGLLADAVSHALAADDSEYVADLVELAIPGIRRNRHDRDLRDWLRQLPEDVVRARPLLAMFVGWVRLSEGDLDGASVWMDRAEHALESRAEVEPITGETTATAWGPIGSEGLPPALLAAARDRDQELGALPAQIEVYRASIAQGRGEIAGTIDHATRARELARPTDHLARSGAAGFLGLAAWAAGDLTTAVDTFEECVQALHDAGDTADELGATVVIASMWLALGRPDEARRRYERAIQTAENRTGTLLSTIGDLHVGLADVLRENGELDDAAKHLQTAREFGDQASLVENRFRWYSVTAALQRSHGQLDAAAATLEHAQSLYLPGFFPDTRPLPATLACVRIAQARLADAWEWAAANQVTVDTEPTYLAEHNLLTLARLYIAQYRADGDPARLDTAADLLDRVVDAARAADRPGSLIEARLVRCLAHEARGDEDSALGDLSEALAAGVPAGYARLFLDEGPHLEALVREAAASEHRGAASAWELLGATVRSGSRPEPAAGQPTLAASVGREELSERELEVLRLLASDLTGPEIAEHLFVSVNTLRSHTKHIFTKLDVNNRRAAVHRATDLGLR